MAQPVSFPVDLWDSFETVCARLKQASAFERSVSTLMAAYAKETREYARKILALTKVKDEEELYTLNTGWLGAKQEIDKLGNLFMKAADDITYKVAQPVENHIKETQKIKQKGKETGRKLITDLTESVKVLSGSKSEYEKAMRVYDQTKADNERASNLNELYNSTKVKKKLEGDKKKAEAAEKKYRRCVEKTQQLEAKLFDTEMPRILGEFEEMERSRISTVRSSLESFARSYIDFIPLLDAVCNNLNAHVTSINPDGDVNQFIMDKRTGKDKETQRTQFEEFNSQYRACVREGSLPSVNNSPAPVRNTPAPVAAAPPVANDPIPPMQSSNSQSSMGSMHQSRIASTPDMSGSMRQVNQPSPVASYQSQNTMPIGNQYQSEPRQVQAAPQAPAPTPAAAPAAPKTQCYCRGMHDYTATQKSELSFKKGDIIKVLEKDPSGWWVGELNGVMGFFPSVDWVEEIRDAAPPAAAPTPQAYAPPPVNRAAKQVPQSYQPAPQATQSYQQPAPVQPQQYQPPPQAHSSMRRCKALFPMDAQNPNELSLHAGDIIQIEKEADGWYLGTNARGERGIFPASFVVLE